MEIRSFTVELREDLTRQSPGRLVGTVLTYCEMASDRREIFETGALTWPADGVTLNRQHQRGAPIMRVTPEVRGDAIVIDVPLPDTAAGRDAAAEVRAGLFKGLSVEFRAIKDAYRNGIRYIEAAGLWAVGLVDSPSYAGSVAEVRTKRRRVWL